MNAIAASKGIISIAEATRLTGVSRQQVRGWLLGYPQRRGKPQAPPILRRQHEPRDGELALGFLDLLEVAFLGLLVPAAKRQGRSLRWQSLRQAAETARRRFQAEHPFALRRIHTDGHAVLVETLQATGDPALYDLTGDSFAMFEILARSFVASVEYDGDVPTRWFPDGRFPRIVVDPRRSFGRPTELLSRVPAETLFDAWQAERGDVAKVAAYFAIEPEAVDEAVRFVLGVGLGSPRPM